MITPDDCTSTMCKPPKSRCVKCSHSIFNGEFVINNKTYRFCFNPLTGVDFVDENDNVIEINNNSNEIWDKFNEWYLKRFKDNDNGWYKRHS